MSFWDTIKSGVSGYFEKRNLGSQEEEALRREVEIEERKIFNEQFKKNALEVAKANAYRDAAKKSGIQKLRAMNRVRRLNETGSPPGSFFSKLSEYTKKNLANREENLTRTKMMREEAQKMGKERLAKNIAERESRIGKRQFGQTTWKM